MNKPEKKDDDRRSVVFFLAICFAIAERVGGQPRGAASNLNDAEAFIKEAEARGIDPRQGLS